MIKVVKIDGVDYTLKSSVGTIKDFKQMYNKDYTQVLKRFINMKKKALTLSKEDFNEYWLTQIVKMSDDVMQLAFLMIQEAKAKGENKNFNYERYEEWAKDVSHIDTNAYLGVIEVAQAVFCG